MGLMNGADDRNVLTMEQFSLLHEIILSWPDGKVVFILDPDLRVIADLGYVKSSVPSGRWLPTEDGLNHVLPPRLRQSAVLH